MMFSNSYNNIGQEFIGNSQQAISTLALVIYHGDSWRNVKDNDAFVFERCVILEAKSE